jgi:hypothetical protein
MWTPIPFVRSRHAEQTLPQVMFVDPDWFFWAAEEGLFQYGSIATDAEKVLVRACRIRIPDDGTPRQVMYAIDRGRFEGLHIVRAGIILDGGGSGACFDNHIDMSFPRQMHEYDKGGGKILIRDVKEYLFGSPHYRMTRDRAEAFFEDDRNFCLHGECPACVRTEDVRDEFKVESRCSSLSRPPLRTISQ